MFDGFAEAYKYALTEVMRNPHYESSPRGKAIREIINFSFGIRNPLNNTFSNQVRSIPKKYLAGELEWYFSGSNKVEDIVKYSGFWEHIKNPDGTANSAYGYLLFKKDNKWGETQWKWAYNSLVKDADTRQAIMYFGGPDYQFEGNKDFVCTCFAQFFIRTGKLHMVTTMRSNDLVRGTTFDVPFFLLLQQTMHQLLRNSTYPDLELGGYIHNAVSAHIYAEHYDLVEDMLRHPFVSESTPAMNIPIVDARGVYQRQPQPLYNWIQANK